MNQERVQKVKMATGCNGSNPARMHKTREMEVTKVISDDQIRFEVALSKPITCTIPGLGENKANEIGSIELRLNTETNEFDIIFITVDGNTALSEKDFQSNEYIPCVIMQAMTAILNQELKKSKSLDGYEICKRLGFDKDLFFKEIGRVNQINIDYNDYDFKYEIELDDNSSVFNIMHNATKVLIYKIKSENFIRFIIVTKDKLLERFIGEGLRYNILLELIECLILNTMIDELNKNTKEENKEMNNEKAKKVIREDCKGEVNFKVILPEPMKYYGVNKEVFKLNSDCGQINSINFRMNKEDESYLDVLYYSNENETSFFQSEFSTDENLEYLTYLAMNTLVSSELNNIEALEGSVLCEKLKYEDNIITQIDSIKKIDALFEQIEFEHRLKLNKQSVSFSNLSKVDCSETVYVYKLKDIDLLKFEIKLQNGEKIPFHNGNGEIKPFVYFNDCYRIVEDLVNYILLNIRVMEIESIKENNKINENEQEILKIEINNNSHCIGFNASLVNPIECGNVVSINNISNDAEISEILFKIDKREDSSLEILHNINNAEDFLYKDEFVVYTDLKPVYYKAAEEIIKNELNNINAKTGMNLCKVLGYDDNIFKTVMKLEKIDNNEEIYDFEYVLDINKDSSSFKSLKEKLNTSRVVIFKEKNKDNITFALVAESGEFTPFSDFDTQYDILLELLTYILLNLRMQEESSKKSDIVEPLSYLEVGTLVEINHKPTKWIVFPLAHNQRNVIMNMDNGTLLEFSGLSKSLRFDKKIDPEKCKFEITKIYRYTHHSEMFKPIPDKSKAIVLWERTKKIITKEDVAEMLNMDIRDFEIQL